ncbi:uncharacterized protein LOC126894261 [Daktulosphaira vitifoliae]|uniref:uncharacterized protein LOC126894261 n=1 Tax=Daktulosphaira vitifoliae TaxID=58002 RepID=UPI0021AAFF03|nr:uncharacterized protein LOC126894261 [Daktulosphaira vitifoliae]XP_050521100.1 uncharacterized protein LOC126894261 [Daktulosphaira vitifoliae]
MDTPINSLKIIILLTLTMTCILGAPANDKSVEQDNESNSKILNEVGPSQEDWKLYEQLSKAKAFDPSNDSGNIKKLFKEIEEFSQLAQTTSLPNDNNDSTRGNFDDKIVQKDSESASSDWFNSLWKEITARSSNDDDDSDRTQPNTTTTETPIDVLSSQVDQQQNEDNGPVEDIVKNLSDDLKKFYNKIKQIIKVVKNWVEQRKDGDYVSEMTGSATEQDGVFVIADPIIGDNDKSNKYVLPINAQ